jgi:hypothetical protein
MQEYLQTALIFDFDQLLAASGWVGDVQLKIGFNDGWFFFTYFFGFYSISKMDGWIVHTPSWHVK